MALVVKELLSSDKLNEIIDKVNFNFDQMLLNGGGPRGIAGKDSLVKGIPGIRGNIWHYGVSDPNTETFTDILDNDLYLQSNGNIWECTDSINNIWVNTSLNIKGETGDDGQDGTGIFSEKDGTGHNFYYIPPENLGTGATDIRSFLFGGYPESGGHEVPSSIYEGLNAGDSIMYLYTPSTGLKQLKFLHEETVSVANAPSIYSITNDVLYIENTREIDNPSIVDGIKLKTTDTSITLDSYRDISITADGRYSINNNGVATSVGNLNLIAYDSTVNNHADPSKVRIENTLFGTSNSAFIELKADAKSGDRYIYMESTSNSSNITLREDLDITARYLNLNATQDIGEFSNDILLADNSPNALVTEYAIKTYVDTAATNLQNNLDTHINDTGASHTYINQSVTTTAQPQFSAVYIDGTGNYIETTSGNLTLKTNTNELLIAGTTSTMYINYREPSGGSPNHFIFNNGSSSSYAGLTIANLNLHGNVSTGGYWISQDGSSNGIYMHGSHVVRISSLAGSGNRIVYANSAGDLYSWATNSAFNKNFGTTVGTVPYIGSNFSANYMVGTNGSGYLETLSASSARSRMGLTGTSNTTHYHDQRYIRKDTSSTQTFYAKLAVASTNYRSAGMYGTYDSTKIGHIWSMGTSYNIPDNGANFGDLYGLAYKHTNNTTGGTMASGHMGVWCQNGTPYVAMGTNFWVRNNAIVGGTLTLSSGGYVRGGSSGGAYFRSDGNVGIKTTGSSSYALYVSGSTYASGNAYINGDVTGVNNLTASGNITAQNNLYGDNLMHVITGGTCYASSGKIYKFQSFGDYDYSVVTYGSGQNQYYRIYVSGYSGSRIGSGRTFYHGVKLFTSSWSVQIHYLIRDSGTNYIEFAMADDGSYNALDWTGLSFVIYKTY
jgi:hypothetical protein